MLLFLKNILPRLKKYGDSLDKIETLVDKSWRVVNENNEIIIYRFKRNGILRKSINGNFYDLTWELEGDNAIAIKDPDRKIGEIFKQGFLLDGVLVVQKENSLGTPIFFFNEDILNEDTFQQYLKDYIIKKESLSKIYTDNKIFYSDSINVGGKIFNEDLEPIDESLTITTGEKQINIFRGEITSINFSKIFHSNRGNIIITSNSYSIMMGGIKIGDEAKFEGQFGNIDGEFIINLEKILIIKIESGRIIDVKQKKDEYSYILFVVILIVISIGGLYFYNNKKNSIDEKINPPLIDSTNSNIDTLSNVNNQPGNFDIIKQDQLKSILISYFEMINKREWSKVESLFQSEVKYLGVNQSVLDIRSRLIDYWDAMSGLQNMILYDRNNFRLSTSFDGYTVEADVIDLAEKGIYKIPYLYFSTMTFEISNSNLISSIKSDIKGSKPYFQRMFDLDENITDEDYKSRNNPNDWDSIFKKLKSFSTDSPNKYIQYQEAILNIYGPNCLVENASTSSRVKLEDFIRSIYYSGTSVSYVSKVTTSMDSKIISVY
ncbi:hypothetical protein [Aquirufa aurantiipilula]|uniref:hypothetical protein n=1 Tax=Aquirufa aurantiipilula TaxID=2696561 RepID=UPI001CAA4B4A|nr:hypothetical protein [Aquirufa aurantiipilula]MBZ1327008.1 hypothetical protein [Aquirufa aurantiipilula]